MLKKIIVILVLLFPLSPLSALNLSHLAGRIVLQVESNGEAWYIDPQNSDRYFLGRPADAFKLMREKGIGISNVNLQKIPVGLDSLSGTDSDLDGLPDELEKSIETKYQNKDSDSDGSSDYEELERGTNPNSQEANLFDPAFVAANLGKIFIQVESRGEAWYVYPENGKRYFLGKPLDAFEVMRKLGLGISNSDLNLIQSKTVDFDYSNFEIMIHDLVNKERVSSGLAPLEFNSDVARVAREHSQNLADENKSFSSFEAICSYPMIHHEGDDFGIYQSERLDNRGIKYFSSSGENIALLSAAQITLTYQEGTVDDGEFEMCSKQRSEWDNEFKAKMDQQNTNQLSLTILADEIEKRKKAFSATKSLDVSDIDWESDSDLARRAVEGWMNSPGHRENILKSEYNEAGMGVAFVNSYVIITQVFIKKIECGYEGSTCCQRDEYSLCYEPNTCVDSICQKP